MNTGELMANKPPIEPEVAKQSHLSLRNFAVAGLATLSCMSAQEAIQPESAQAAANWTRLGGDPLQRNVDTRNKFVKLMTSDKGSTALRYAGLSKQERVAVKKEARTGDFAKCQLEYGEKFKRMSFGINGTSVDRDVTFRDPRYKNKSAPAWCMSIKVPISGTSKHETKYRKRNIEVPFACGNIALKKSTIVTKRTPTRPPAKPPVVYTPKPALTPVVVQYPAPLYSPDININNQNVYNNANTNTNNNTNPNTNINTNNNTTNTPNTPPPPAPPNPTPAVNQKPTGNPNPSRHRYVSSVNKECVDDIRDPEGDNVEAKDFRFTNSQGLEVGGIVSGVYKAAPNVQCVDWDSGSQTIDGVTMSVTLDDTKGNTPRLVSQYTFPVLQRP